MAAQGSSCCQNIAGAFEQVSLSLSNQRLVFRAARSLMAAFPYIIQIGFFTWSNQVPNGILTKAIVIAEVRPSLKYTLNKNS